MKGCFLDGMKSHVGFSRERSPRKYDSALRKLFKLRGIAAFATNGEKVAASKEKGARKKGRKSGEASEDLDHKGDPSASRRKKEKRRIRTRRRRSRSSNGRGFDVMKLMEGVF